MAEEHTDAQPTQPRFPAMPTPVQITKGIVQTQITLTAIARARVEGVPTESEDATGGRQVQNWGEAADTDGVWVQDEDDGGEEGSRAGEAAAGDGAVQYGGWYYEKQEQLTLDQREVQL